HAVQRGHALHRHADRADAVLPDPNPGVLTPAFGRDAVLGAGLNGRFFELAHEGRDFAKAFEPHDRIDHQLPGAVIGGVAAALDPFEIDTARAQIVGTRAQAFVFALTPDG